MRFEITSRGDHFRETGDSNAPRRVFRAQPLAKSLERRVSHGGHGVHQGKLNRFQHTRG